MGPCTEQTAEETNYLLAKCLLHVLETGFQVVAMNKHHGNIQQRLFIRVLDFSYSSHLLFEYKLHLSHQLPGSSSIITINIVFL